MNRPAVLSPATAGRLRDHLARPLPRTPETGGAAPARLLAFGTATGPAVDGWYPATVSLATSDGELLDMDAEAELTGPGSSPVRVGVPLPVVRAGASPDGTPRFVALVGLDGFLARVSEACPDGALGPYGLVEVYVSEAGAWTDVAGGVTVDPADAAAPAEGWFHSVVQKPDPADPDGPAVPGALVAGRDYVWVRKSHETKANPDPAGPDILVYEIVAVVSLGGEVGLDLPSAFTQDPTVTTCRLIATEFDEVTLINLPSCVGVAGSAGGAGGTALTFGEPE